MGERTVAIFQTLNQLLTAGIAITAFSLLLYALTFNLRDRVARSFAIILACVVIVFVGDAIASVITVPEAIEAWLKMQWVGVIFLPSAYLHFSDALLATTGRPSRGRRRLLIRLTYFVSLLFLLALPANLLVGEMTFLPRTGPYLARTGLTWLFVLYYVLAMTWALVNLWRALRRSLTRTGKRRMAYLLAGASAPAMGSFPYLLFGPDIAATFPGLFWLAVTLSNLLVAVLIVLMAYSVAFFGVSWPDRIVKRRLFKWLMRGPFTASVVLTATTLVRRLGESFGATYTSLVPVVMVGTLLLIEYFITLAAPVWERWLFYGGDRSTLRLLQTLEERLITSGDLKQFLESILAAICDRLQVQNVFIVTLSPTGLEIVLSVGSTKEFDLQTASGFLPEMHQNGSQQTVMNVGNYWVAPLHGKVEPETGLLGFIAIEQAGRKILDDEQREALNFLADRASLALADRARQQSVFSSLETLAPQVDLIQRLRAASRYDSAGVMQPVEEPFKDADLAVWVKDALNHYWGGPKLTSEPLMRLQIVQQALQEHQDNPSNAVRAILRKAVEQVRPEGERRFTAEWILYNILELKFLEGRKVREVASRLAMSEADLYRKQRVAIESVTQALLEMEAKARQDSANEQFSLNRSSTQTRMK